jgi:hypothetical protein
MKPRRETKSMLPNGYILQSLPHRLRLRVPSKKRNHTYFNQLKARIEPLNGIDRVEINPITGSILILHHRDLLSIQELSAHLHIFNLKGERKSRTHFPEWRRGSKDGMVTGIIVLALYQIWNKCYLPPAWSLLRDAWNIKQTHF